VRYRILGFVVETDVALDLDQVLEPVTPDITFQQLTAELRDSVVCFPFHTLKQNDGTYWQSWSKSDHGYRLQFHDQAIFWLATDGRRIRCFLYPETPINTLTHLLLDQVLPYAISLRGQTVLHAGAVLIHEKAAVFLGTTGSGKSTLTASFCAAGFPLLADDSLLVQPDHDKVWVIGSYPSVRLWSDSVDAVAPAQPLKRVSHYNDKQRLIPNAEGIIFHPDPVHIAGFYLLDNTGPPMDTVEFELVSPGTVFVALMRHTFRLDITDRVRAQQEFEALTQLAGRVPLYRLRYPREYDFLPQVRQAIIEHLEHA